MRITLRDVLVVGVVCTSASLFAAEPAKSAAPAAPAKQAPVKSDPNVVRVLIKTSAGDIELELDRAKAPVSVDNFVQYAKAGHYDGTVFHRVISNFMIQGGGMDADLKEKPVRAPIKNEGDNGLRNDRGTIAMARTSAPDSATSQFYINLKNNDFLNAQPGRPGYAVFGKVTKGMEVVDKIAGVPTGSKGMHQNVPVTPVVIQSVKVL
ncbi:MAG: peptidylprolyl isomerase [Myxococcota bacterium]